MKIIPSVLPFLKKQRTCKTKSPVVEITGAVDLTVRMIGDDWQLVESILDIGCGVGISTCSLAKKFQASIAVIDGTGDASVQSGRGTNGPWNDMAVTKAMLEENGVEAVIYNIGDEIRGKFDLITSYASWGWHYPISTYDYRKLLNPGGFISIDIRRGFEGEIPSDWVLVESCKLNHKRTHCLYRYQPTP